MIFMSTAPGRQLGLAESTVCTYNTASFQIHFYQAFFHPTGIKMKPDTRRPSQPCFVQICGALPPQLVLKMSHAATFLRNFSFVSIVSGGGCPSFLCQKIDFHFSLCASTSSKGAPPKAPFQCFAGWGDPEGILWACFKFANV